MKYQVLPLQSDGELNLVNEEVRDGSLVDRPRILSEE